MTVLIFRRKKQFLTVCEKLREKNLPFETLSSSKLELPPQLQPPQRTVPVAGFCGGLFGFAFFYFLCLYSFLEYPLIVAGQPIHSGGPFALIAYEGAILLSMFFCFYSFLATNRLPDYRSPEPWRDKAWKYVSRGSFAIYLPETTADEPQDWGADEIF